MIFKKGHMDLELPWKIKEPTRMNYLISDHLFHQSPVLQENKKKRKYDKHKNNTSIMTIT